MFNNKKRYLVAFTFLTTLNAIAQNAVPDTSGENGFMRSEGKIYVVMVVVITILAGLILYVARLDQKLSKLEKGKGV
jgi:hypothetical protein